MTSFFVVHRGAIAIILGEPVFFSCISLILIIRLALTQTMGLMPQDAYYYYYGQHLALSCFDHPPMIAYLLRGFTEIFGSGEGAIKMADFTLSTATIFLVYRLAVKFLSVLRARLAALCYASTLLLSVLSLNSTPDVPLVFFWCVSLLLMYHALLRLNPLVWFAAGLSMGLAFLSKYTALFLPFGFVLYLLLSRNHRHLLWSWKIVLLVIGLLLGMLLVIIWNYQYDWISLLFQSSDRASEISNFRLQPLDFLGNVGTQMLLLLPPLFWGLYYALCKDIRSALSRKKWLEDDQLFLFAFCLPIILFFTGVSLFYWVKLSWMMPAYITGIILASKYLKMSWLKWQLGIALLFHILVFIQIVYYPVPIKSDDTWVGWTEMANQVRELKQLYPDHFVFAHDDYKTSAMLSYYLEEEVFAGNVIGQNGKQFAIVRPDLSFLHGKHALFIDSDKMLRDENPRADVPDELHSYFTSVRQLNPILIHDHQGRLIRKFWVFEASNYLSGNTKH